MDLLKNVEINLEKNIKKEEFLNSTLWNTINNGLDIGLRYALPDLIEDEIIDLKNNLINLGLKDGIKQSINSIIDTGKQALGVLTGNFKDIDQLTKVIRNGGLIDKVSESLDIIIKKGQDTGKINYILGNTLKNGKNTILSSVERNIESTLNSQINSAKLVDKYIDNWKEFYNNKDFDGMQKEYSKIEKELKQLVPLENTFKNARFVENIHTLIKNKGQDFNLSEDEIELAKRLNL